HFHGMLLLRAAALLAPAVVQAAVPEVVARHGAAELQPEEAEEVWVLVETCRRRSNTMLWVVGGLAAGIVLLRLIAARFSALSGIVIPTSSATYVSDACRALFHSRARYCSACRSASSSLLFCLFKRDRSNPGRQIQTGSTCGGLQHS